MEFSEKLPLDKFLIQDKKNIDEQIIKRVQFVIKDIMFTCGIKEDEFKIDSNYIQYNINYICSNDPNEILYTSIILNKQNFTYRGDARINSTYAILNDKNYILYSHFPKRWIFSDYKEELLDGLKKYKLKMQARANKIKQTKENNKSKKIIINSIKEKLTPEEIKILKSIKGKI